MSKRPFVSPLLPFLSGVLLYLFAAGWKIFAALAAPLIYALHEGSPRLAVLGWLGLAISPAVLAALTHRVTHGVIDLFDRDAARAPARCSRGVASVWAGLLAWFAMCFAALTSVLILLLVFPLPSRNEWVAEVIALAEDWPLRLGVHAGIWILVATMVFWVERAARGQQES